MRAPSYKKKKKAELCAFSPKFKERVKEIRSKLDIPEGGFPKEKRTVLGPPEKGFPKELSFYPLEATKWYAAHVQKTTGRPVEELPRNLPRYYWYFPRKIAELIKDLACSQQPCRPGFYPDVPLDCCAMDLVREFDLPEDVVNEVKHHILVEESSGFGVSPMLQPIIVPMEGQGGPYFCALIAGIDGSTTKKGWEDIWKLIKSQMKEKGVKIAPTKRDEEKIEIRDLTWWTWSQQDLRAKEILDKWSKEHPEDKKTYDIDTANAAVKRIEEIMRPIS
jgi:hypothetical protein